MIYGGTNQLDKLKVIFGITNLIISIVIKIFFVIVYLFYFDKSLQTLIILQFYMQYKFYK